MDTAVVSWSFVVVGNVRVLLVVVFFSHAADSIYIYQLEIYQLDI